MTIADLLIVYYLTCEYQAVLLNQDFGYYLLNQLSGKVFAFLDWARFNQELYS
jgi:hypothetical protein